MRTGDRYVSEETGRCFVIKKLDRKEITVEVERVVRKGDKSLVEKHVRVVLRSNWDSFARAYQCAP